MEAMGGGDGVFSSSSGGSPGHVDAKDGCVWPPPCRECWRDNKDMCPCNASVPRVRSGRPRREEGRTVSMVREHATVLGMSSRSLERFAKDADAMYTCVGSMGALFPRTVRRVFRDQFGTLSVSYRIRSAYGRYAWYCLYRYRIDVDDMSSIVTSSAVSR